MIELNEIHYFQQEDDFDNNAELFVEANAENIEGHLLNTYIDKIMELKITQKKIYKMGSVTVFIIRTHIK